VDTYFLIFGFFVENVVKGEFVAFNVLGTVKFLPIFQLIRKFKYFYFRCQL